MIRVIVSPDISTEPYRKGLVVILFVIFFLCPLTLLLLLIILPQWWWYISPCQPVQWNVKRSASWNRFVTLSLTSVTFKLLDSWIPPGKQLWFQPIATRTLRSSPFDTPSRKVPLTSAFPRQPCHSVFSVASAEYYAYFVGSCSYSAL